MNNLADILNFVGISANLTTAGQPSEEQLRALRDRGHQLVVNLGLLDPRYCLPNEAKSVAVLGMQYVHIPVDFQSPQLRDLERFEETLRASKGKKVFVHCAANYRVSCFMALYGEAELGWSRAQADAHLKRVWEPNEVWSAFLERVRFSRQHRQ